MPKKFQFISVGHIHYYRWHFILFQTQIMNVYKEKLSHEERRFQNITTQMRNQHFSALRQWRATKRFFTGERGAWAER